MKQMKLVQRYTLVVAKYVDINDPDDREEIEMVHDEFENAVNLDIWNIGQEIPYFVSKCSMESHWEEERSA